MESVGSSRHPIRKVLFLKALRPRPLSETRNGSSRVASKGGMSILPGREGFLESSAL